MIKKFFKLLKMVLVVLFIAVIAVLIYSYVDYKNQAKDELQREAQAQIEEKVKQDSLARQLESANIFVTKVNNSVALTVLRTEGNIKLSHDKTPQNNKWLEWLINSDIKVYADFKTAFTIETDLIEMTINEEDASVLITYDPDDIKLSFVEISDIYTSTRKSVFGSSYKPEEVTALQQIAHDDVKNYTNNENNIKQAQDNLEDYLEVLAKNLNVNVKIQAK